MNIRANRERRKAVSRMRRAILRTEYDNFGEAYDNANNALRHLYGSRKDAIVSALSLLITKANRSGPPIRWQRWNLTVRATAGPGRTDPFPLCY